MILADNWPWFLDDEDDYTLRRNRHPPTDDELDAMVAACLDDLYDD